MSKTLRPSAVFLFDKKILLVYAQRLVRKELFSIYCSEEHRCVISENGLIRESESEIADLIRENGLQDPSPNLKDAYVLYLRRLVCSTIANCECDDHFKNEIAARIATYNIATPFEIATAAPSADPGNVVMLH